MKKLVLAAVIVTCLAFQSASAYAAVSFTSEATFLTAIQAGYYLEDFSTYSYGSNTPNPLSLSANGYAYSMSSPDGLFPITGAMSTVVYNESINISFTGNSVTAIGGIFGPSDNVGNIVAGYINLTLSDGTSLSNYHMNVGDFLGFTSTVPITSMSINTPDSGMYIQVDHFYVGAAGTVVPVPGAVWLLGSGLIGLIGIRRRVKK